MARKEDSLVTRRVSSQMDKTRQGLFNFPSRPKNILWYLVHRYLFKGIGLLRVETWDQMLKKYVTDPKNGIIQTPAHRTSTRGNITAQVFSEDEGMSVSTFVKAAVVAGVEEIELLAIWKMPNGKRIVGKIRYPLTEDVLLSLNEDDVETEIVSQVNDFLQSDSDDDTTSVDDLIAKLTEYKNKKKGASK